MGRMTEGELAKRAMNAWHTTGTECVEIVRAIENEAFEAGREKGQEEARKVVGAPLSEDRVEVLRRIVGYLTPAEHIEVFGYINYLRSVIALMTNDSGQYAQGKIDGLLEAKEIVWDATGGKHRVDPDTIDQEIEERIKELRLR